MSDLMRSLRDEIRRQTKKTFRADIDKLQKTVSQQRRDIAKIKRDLEAAQKRISFLETQERKRIAGSKSEKPVRFSAKSVKSHRSRLGLSAAEYGKLIGVSGPTIYQWERGKSRPRKPQIEMLVEVRSIGRKEARARLRILADEDSD